MSLMNWWRLLVLRATCARPVGQIVGHAHPLLCMRLSVISQPFQVQKRRLPNISYRPHLCAQAADSYKTANRPQKRRGPVHSPCLTDLIL